LYSLNRSEDGGATTSREHVVYFAGRPVAIVSVPSIGSETYTFLNTDHLGTPFVASNAAGEEIWAGGFEPFGRDWREGLPEGAQANGVFLRFPGQWFDEVWRAASLGSEEYYNLFRWYGRNEGKYLRVDPIVADLHMPTVISNRTPEHFGLQTQLFSYAHNNPITAIDPYGLAVCVYTINQATIKCRFEDGTVETVGPDGVFSGVGLCENNSLCQNFPYLGPIQSGAYRMNLDERPGHQTWWRLEPMPRVPGWKVRLHLARGGFAMHLGQSSLGCINIDRNNVDAAGRYSNLFNRLLGEWDRNILLVSPGPLPPRTIQPIPEYWGPTPLR
jgi:RHS repeat-associated protein